MLHDLKNTKNQGFTIIETLIVLAIAGLIILIVLLAVPALQRSSQNTNIKSDVSALSTGITSFESNNNGMLPTGFSGPSNGVETITGPSGSTGATGNASITVKVQQSDVITLQPTPPTAGSTIPVGQIDPVSGYTCARIPNTRAYSLWYSIETSSSQTQLQCMDS